MNCAVAPKGKRGEVFLFGRGINLAVPASQEIAVGLVRHIQASRRASSESLLERHSAANSHQPVGWSAGRAGLTPPLTNQPPAFQQLGSAAQQFHPLLIVVPSWK